MTLAWEPAPTTIRRLGEDHIFTAIWYYSLCGKAMMPITLFC
jgi:hypothetical protein